MKEEMNLSDLWGGCIWSSSKSKTNADRIRSSSDEELAVICEDGCPPQHECPPIKGEEMGLRSVCQKCWLDWLKSPVEQEADNG